MPESFFHAPAKQKLKGLLHKVGNRRLRLPKNSLLLAVDGSEKINLRLL